jgi:uncharacterized membrane protein
LLVDCQKAGFDVESSKSFLFSHYHDISTSFITVISDFVAVAAIYLVCCSSRCGRNCGSQVGFFSYAGGVIGTLIGADLLHLKDIQAMSAGVFDGIALCGLFALLLS